MGRKRVVYPCTVCSKECGDGTIECSNCNLWTHASCVGRGEALLESFSKYSYYCPRCALDKGSFDWGRCLKR